ncbi:unannotated protein [freshwater metagenome]|uniref:Unannotated protein n=1 Tax=freshwater metagenome TaxID=449393 RepID=A0A6J6TBK5_9ZZZZ
MAGIGSAMTSRVPGEAMSESSRAIWVSITRLCSA